MYDLNLDWCRSVRVVMSRGSRVSVRGLRFVLVVANAALETGGRGGEDEFGDGSGGDGGRVEEGSGEVREKMRAAARGSVWMLNSARGVICGVWVLAHLLAYFDLTSCERHSQRLGISSHSHSQVHPPPRP